MAKREKEKYILFGSAGWDKQLVAIGSSLYEEYGRHPSLQSAVQTYREAGDSKAAEKGSLYWLFYHHVPEESRRLLVDPYAVLSHTLFLGGCDMGKVCDAMRRISPEAAEALERWKGLYVSEIEVRL